MPIRFALIALLVLSACATAKTPARSEPDPCVTARLPDGLRRSAVPDNDTVDEPAEPIGGLRAMQRRVVYPDAAKAAGHQGIVRIEFYIDTNGCPVEPVLLQNVEASVDAAALDALMATRYTPARLAEEPVLVLAETYITFKLH